MIADSCTGEKKNTLGNRCTQLLQTQLDKITTKNEYWDGLSPPYVYLDGEFRYIFVCRFFVVVGQLGLHVPNIQT